MSDVITWLQHASEFPKFFWKERNSYSVWALAGAQRDYLSFPEKPTSRVFGAQAFLPFRDSDPLWSDFPPCYFFEPQEIREAALSSIEKSDLSLSPIHKLYTPEQTRWHESIEQTKNLITEGTLKKAVLARKTTFTFEETLNPWDLLRALLHTSYNSTVFAFQPSPSSLFLGATPEKLYSRTGRDLFTESVAGTRPLASPDAELLTSGKECAEFSIVKEWITNALLPCATSLSWQAQDSIIKTNAVKHLYNRLSAHLKEGVSDKRLTAALHPTPAMGGSPRKEALEWIRAIEPFNRGLYAAPIGWMEPEGADFAVAIRSALIKENALHLFTGAGIVADSDPGQEWEEVEIKMGLFTQWMKDELCKAHH